MLVAILLVSAWAPRPACAGRGLYEDLFSVHFPNEKNGWACGRWGALLHTADGGLTWVRQSSGTSMTLMSICFVDAKHGWAVGNGGTIIHTTDGGETWEDQESPVPYYHMGVHFADHNTGWIVTERTHILFTDDGGRNWRIQFKDEDYILKSVSFVDRNNGWAVGEYGYIYHTGDGGLNWEHQAGYSGYDDKGDLVGGSFLFDVEAVDTQTAWAVGIDGHVIKTVDGGKIWQEVVTGAPKTQLFCVASDRRGEIAIGGKGTFLSSADNGRTWKTLKFDPPIDYGWIYGLDRRRSSKFIAVGWKGSIYRKTSHSWHKVR